MMNEKMSEYSAAEQAEGMRKKIESGDAMNYPEAEKLQEKEELIKNLTEAQEYIKKASPSYIAGLLNASFHFKKAGELGLAERVEQEVIPKSCIISISESLKLLEDFNNQDDENFDKAMDGIGHNIFQIAKFGEAGSYSTEFDKIILEFIADISFAQEDHAYIILYKKIGETEKYEEVRKIAEKTKSCRDKMSMDEGREYKDRNKSPERVDTYKKLMRVFLEKVKDLKENNIDFERVVAEIGQEIKNKLKQAKQGVLTPGHSPLTPLP